MGSVTEQERQRRLNELRERTREILATSERDRAETRRVLERMERALAKLGASR